MRANFSAVACLGLGSDPNWYDFGFTIQSLLPFARMGYPAVRAHLLWTDLERQSALLEREGRKGGADRGKSPPSSNERRVAAAATAEDKMGTFKEYSLEEKCPLLWEEALWASAGKEHGPRMRECSGARERRHVCDFWAGYEQGGFEE